MAGFEVQQSADGGNFVTVSYVKAHGMPSGYSAIIAQDLPKAWYRLRSVDLDGKFEYTQVVYLSLNCRTDGEGLSVFPNPLKPGMR